MEEQLLIGSSLWIVLQALAFWLLHGPWRKAALLSPALMLLAIAIAVLGALAPIWVVVALPVCLFWIAALWIVRLVTWVVV
jgi:hypothetical protein